MKNYRYFLLLLLLTIIYLTVEVAFNASLLDVVGSDTTLETIENVEHYGRIISGTALALFIYGLVVSFILEKKQASAKICITVLLLIGSVTIYAVYALEEELIETLVENSSPEQRRIAAIVQVATSQLRKHNLEIYGMELSSQTLTTPEGKAFIALFSPLIHTLPKIEELLDSNIKELIKESIKQEFKKNLESPNVFYETVYMSSITTLKTLFSNYKNSITTYNEERANYTQYCTSKWKQYKDHLKRYGVTPQTVPKSRWADVRDYVRQQGLPVTNSWTPDDQQGFYNECCNVYNQSLTNYLVQIKDTFGLPTNLTTFEAFVAHDKIQKEWQQIFKEKTKTSFTPDIKITPSLPPIKVEENLYQPFLSYQAELKYNELNEPSSSFASNGKLETLGKTAMRSILVPPIALFFSIFGGILHVCKLNYIMVSKFFSKKIAWTSLVILLILQVTFPLNFPTSITSNSEFSRLESNAITTKTIYAIPARWIIQMQPFAYPIANNLRKKLGINFIKTSTLR